GADDDRLPRLRLADLHEAVPRGDPGHADRTQIRRERHVLGVDLAQHAGLAAVDDRVLLPATVADDVVAGLVVRMARFDDFADGAALHHLVERLRLRVALGVVHAAAHVRVEAQEVVANEHLPLARRTDGLFEQAEVVGRRLAARTRDEMDLSIDLRHGACLLCCQSEAFGRWMRLPPAGNPLRYLNVPVACATNSPSPPRSDASQNAIDAVRCSRLPVATRRPRPGRRNIVFISTVTTPDSSAMPSSPGARAACAMTTSSSVIETSPCATLHELVSSSRSVSAISASPRSKRTSSKPSRSTNGMRILNCNSLRRDDCRDAAVD